MKLTLTEPDAYKLRTVLNQVLEDGYGKINDVSGSRVGDMVKIEMEGSE